MTAVFFGKSFGIFCFVDYAKMLKAKFLNSWQQTSRPEEQQTIFNPCYFVSQKSITFALRFGYAEAILRQNPPSPGEYPRVWLIQ